MFDWPAVSALVILAGLLGALGKHISIFGFTAGSKLQDFEGHKTLLVQSLAKIEMLNSRFIEHEKEDVKMFARLEATLTETNRQQIAVEHRFVSAINDLSTELRGINERIDRIFERDRNGSGK